MSAELADVVERSGLIPPGSRGVVLVSGGPDSACAAAGAVAVCGAAAVIGLHLNYGLREDSDEDEKAARALCEKLGILLEVERPSLAGDGNLQAMAREARYTAAEALADRTGASWIATGHTRSDLAETVVYRLAVSPGTRALGGLPPRRGRIVRPLLALTRQHTRRLADDAGLPFRDDPSNRDPRYARNRVRHQVMPPLTELNPAAEEAIAETAAELAEEAEVLDRLVADAIDRATPLEQLEPALRRLVLRAQAERVAGRPVALGRSRAEDIWRLSGTPTGGEVDLGGGVIAVCEAGRVHFRLGGAAEPLPARMAVPGSCRFGEWELRADLRPAPIEPAGPELATLDAAKLGPALEVRSWREGDRMRPLGLDGTKSVQDLFTDAKVPRSLRRTLPVVTAGGEIAWVAGVAVSEDFKITEETREAAVLTARTVD
jgi:tRNA(Ile)-lysidine synthase